MKVYVFGNTDVLIDNNAILAAKELENKIPNVSFIFIKPNEDVPFVDEKRVVILDTVQGITQVELIELKDLEFSKKSKLMSFRRSIATEKSSEAHYRAGFLANARNDRLKPKVLKLSLDQLSASARGSVHDFDLGFQLKYLKKLGKLGEVFIVGLPQSGKIDYSRIKSLLISLSQESAGL